MVDQSDLLQAAAGMLAVVQQTRGMLADERAEAEAPRAQQEIEGLETIFATFYPYPQGPRQVHPQLLRRLREPLPELRVLWLARGPGRPRSAEIR